MNLIKRLFHTHHLRKEASGIMDENMGAYRLNITEYCIDEDCNAITHQTQLLILEPEKTIKLIK